MFLVGLSGSPNGSAGLIEAMGSLLDLVPKVISLITDNPILLLFLAAGFTPIVFKIFRGAKRTATN